MRIFEKPRLEALLLSAGGRAHYPGKQPYASIEDDHRAKLAAGEDIVADRDRFERPRFEDPLVESLEAAAEEDRRPRRPPISRTRACVSGAPRGVSASIGRPSATLSSAAASTSGRSTIPAPAARRRIVDAAMLVGREVADVASPRGSRSPRRALARQGSCPAARETCPGKASGRRRGRSWRRLEPIAAQPQSLRA